MSPRDFSDTGDSIEEGSISWLTEEKRTWAGCAFDLASGSDSACGILAGFCIFEPIVDRRQEFDSNYALMMKEGEPT